MPELPEVETVIRGLRQPLTGRTIQGMWQDWPRAFQKITPDEFNARASGQQFRALRRRGKYIVCELDHDLLVIHLKMSGRLYVAPNDEQHDADRWVHFWLQLDNDTQLRFSDSRKFGRISLTPDLATVIGKMGPEPLEEDFTVEVLKKCLEGRSRIIKPLLLDQSVVAGIGNIYADEALHLARIHPMRRADDLNHNELDRLYDAIREVLNKGIDHEGASINWYRKPDGTRGESQDYFTVYDREGEPCPDCGAAVVKIRLAQRGTHFCPNCQPEMSKTYAK